MVDATPPEGEKNWSAEKKLKAPPLPKNLEPPQVITQADLNLAMQFVSGGVVPDSEKGRFIGTIAEEDKLQIVDPADQVEMQGLDLQLLDQRVPKDDRYKLLYKAILDYLHLPVYQNEQLGYVHENWIEWRNKVSLTHLYKDSTLYHGFLSEAMKKSKYSSAQFAQVKFMLGWSYDQTPGTSDFNIPQNLPETELLTQADTFFNTYFAQPDENRVSQITFVKSRENIRDVCKLFYDLATVISVPAAVK